MKKIIEVSIDLLKDRIFKSVEVYKEEEGIIFTTYSGDKFFLGHQQDCCECVHIDDICGDLSDLTESPILIAEEVTSYDKLQGPDYSEVDSFTWTFYNLATIKGFVTIKFWGESNGYYSERVELFLIE